MVDILIFQEATIYGLLTCVDIQPIMVLPQPKKRKKKQKKKEGKMSKGPSPSYEL